MLDGDATSYPTFSAVSQFLEQEQQHQQGPSRTPSPPFLTSPAPLGPTHPPSPPASLEHHGQHWEAGQEGTCLEGQQAAAIAGSALRRGGGSSRQAAGGSSSSGVIQKADKPGAKACRCTTCSHIFRVAGATNHLRQTCATAKGYPRPLKLPHYRICILLYHEPLGSAAWGQQQLHNRCPNQAIPPHPHHNLGHHPPLGTAAWGAAPAPGALLP